jgi:hypothetical protein
MSFGINLAFNQGERGKQYEGNQDTNGKDIKIP